MSCETTKRFQADVQKTVDYFCDEFELTWAEMVGVLEIIKANLIHDVQHESDDEEGDEDEDEDGTSSNSP